MGLGNLGYDAAKKIQSLGYQVIGWNRSGKGNDPTIPVFADLNDFLKRSKVLICLLPLTNDTKQILNYATLMKLPKDAYVINVARGNHVVEKDLLAAIDSGHIAGAFLDVFVEEPLPIAHPFWHHPKIIVTPHISSNAVFKNAVQQVAINYFAAINNQPLINVIDKTRGY
jgi:glyoxylate/hydroxypyruvate reductase A